MKYIFYFLAAACGVNGFAQTSQARKEITPLIKTTVILKDTTRIRNIASRGEGDLSVHDYNEMYMSQTYHLSPAQFNVFQAAMWQVVRSPKSKVYQFYGAKPWTTKELRGRVIVCDTLMESSFDDKGNMIEKKIWSCDSTSRLHNVNRLDFYESWYFNPATNMIEKEVLGYCVFEYDQEKNIYKGLFNVFRDEKAVAKIKSYMDY